GLVAHFSPDGKRFVVVLRRGNLKQNTNDFSLLLYQTDTVFHSPKPDILLRMSSSSPYRAAISEIGWLADSETLAFLGESPDEVSQVYTFNVRTRLLKKLTNHPTAITSYALTGDGRELVFAAEPTPTNNIETDQER